MLKSLLVGLDASPWSRTAVDLALRWAGPLDAMVVGLGVIDTASMAGEAVPLGASYYKERQDAARLQRSRREVEQLLEQLTLRCSEAGVSCKLLEDEGDPSQQILLEAQRYDLLVLGQRLHFRYSGNVPEDGTLEKVLASSPRPLVAVPEEAHPGVSVVVAYDGSLQAARALQAFQQTGLDLGREVHVVSIDPSHVEAARRADRAAEFLRLHDLRVTVHPIASSASPAEVLLARAKEVQADLLVMGAYGKSTLHTFFFGSVTKTILRSPPPIPLFLYH